MLKALGEFTASAAQTIAHRMITRGIHSAHNSSVMLSKVRRFRDRTPQHVSYVASVTTTAEDDDSKAELSQVMSKFKRTCQNMQLDTSHVEVRSFANEDAKIVTQARLQFKATKEQVEQLTTVESEPVYKLPKRVN